MVLDAAPGRDAAELELLRELGKRTRIHELTVRYARGVDRRDFDEVARCFAPDATVDYGEHYRGDVPGLIAFLCAGLAGFPTTMHFLGNQLVELDGDSARVETYCVAHHRPGAPGRENDLLVVGVRYHDEMACRQDGWRIVERTVVYDWRRCDVGVLRPGVP